MVFQAEKQALWGQLWLLHPHSISIHYKSERPMGLLKEGGKKWKSVWRCKNVFHGHFLPKQPSDTRTLPRRPSAPRHWPRASHLSTAELCSPGSQLEVATLISKGLGNFRLAKLLAWLPINFYDPWCKAGVSARRRRAISWRVHSRLTMK